MSAADREAADREDAIPLPTSPDSYRFQHAGYTFSAYVANGRTYVHDEEGEELFSCQGLHTIGVAKRLVDAYKRGHAHGVTLGAAQLRSRIQFALGLTDAVRAAEQYGERLDAIERALSGRRP